MPGKPSPPKPPKPKPDLVRTFRVPPSVEQPLRVLIVEDSPQHAELAALELTAEAIESAHRGTAEEALDYLRSNDVDVVLSDYHLPGMSGLELLDELKRTMPHLPFVMITGVGNEKLAVAALKAGAADYLIKEARLGYLEVLPTVVRNACGKNRLALELERLRREAAARHGFANIIGSSEPMRQVFRILEAIVPSNATVLITGESGTGKELVARAIHHNGPRSRGPFVACNCGAIPENLVESELFGHERGAFTGATARRIGSFEHSHGGTLFLDEVSELPPLAQVSLLRAVQERIITRVGSNTLIHVDVRIVAASNQDLWELVRQGLFREDLYYRLNVLTVELPPLRERGDDILLLAHTFLDRYSRENSKPIQGFSQEALAVLQRYPWPGNIRELQHAVERAVILARSEEITPGDWPTRLLGEVEIDARPGRLSYNLDQSERALISEALEKTGWNMAQSARLLGISRSTLYSKIQRHGLVPPEPAG